MRLVRVGFGMVVLCISCGWLIGLVLCRMLLWKL